MLKSYQYKGSDRRDKPSALVATGGSVQVKQTFSQMWCLTRLLPLIVGHKVPKIDAWQVMLALIQCIEYIMAPAMFCRTY